MAVRGNGCEAAVVLPAGLASGGGRTVIAKVGEALRTSLALSGLGEGVLLALPQLAKGVELYVGQVAWAANCAH